MKQSIRVLKLSFAAKTALMVAVLNVSLGEYNLSAQTNSFQWAKRVASTINTDFEMAIGMTLDSQGYIYVTGWFDGTNDFGGATLTNKGGVGQDIFVAKYNSAGALQWAKRAGGNSPEWDAGRGIGVDSAGNAYATGGFSGNADFGGVNLAGSPNTEFFLAKYDSAGTVQWARQSSSGLGVYAYGTGLAVDSAGNSYAVGYADNGTILTFGTTSLPTPSTTGYSTFLVKYDNTGTVQWAQLMGGPGQTYATKVAVDAAGNVYVRGSFSENMLIGTSNLVTSGSDQNMFIAKFGNTGALTWVQQAEGGNVDEGGVAVDPAGNVYVSGAFDSTINFGGIILTNAGSLDAFLAKYNSAGVPQWARRAGGTSLDLYWDVALDGQGNVYAAGVLSSNAVAPSGSGGAMVAKYDPAGTLQWTYAATGPPADPVASLAAKVAVDSADTCYLAGWYLTTSTFGTNVLQAQGYLNFFLAKLAAPAVATPPSLSIGWSNGLPQLRITGVIGSRYAVDYVTSLAASNNWQRLATNTLLTNPLSFTDTNAVGNSHRFYRARLVP